MTIAATSAKPTGGLSKERSGTLNRLDVIILSLLRTGDRTGYDVIKWIERNGIFSGYTTKASQVYRQLSRMELDGWAVSRAEPRDSVPDAKLFRISEPGQQKLAEWIDSPYQPSVRPLDPDFQVRLMFSAWRGPEKLLELVRIELNFRRDNENYRRDSDLMLVSTEDSPEHMTWMEEAYRLQSERGHYMVSNLIAWLESAETRLTAELRR